MTREAYVALVERLRPLAENNPAAYRWRVRAFALLGYGFILLLLLGSVGLAALLAALVFVSRHGLVLVLKGGFLLLVFAWKVLRSLWVKFDRPTGRELTRAEAPALYAAVDRLTSALGAPRFHHILLVPDFNAAVVQHPRLGVLGWPRNYLLVGLPLLQSLTTEQAEAVVAHELGHLRGGHGKFGAWIYRVNQTWTQLLAQLEGQTSWVARFFQWYAPTFEAWSFGLNRPEEYEADACAARITSPRIMADALCATHLREATLNRLHWSLVFDGVGASATPPANVYSRLLPVAKSAALPPAEQETVLAEALAVETDAFNTHPALRDRLAALGQEARLVPPPATSAAEVLLGEQLPALAAELDAQWQAQNQEPWVERHQELVQQRARLHDLADRYARHRTLTPEERWELADLTEDHESADAALPLFRALFAEPSQELAARFAVGRILLAQDKAEGLALVDDVMAREPNAHAAGLAIKQGYFARIGDQHAARELEAAQLRHADQLDAAEAERATLRSTDTYLPHQLPPDEPTLTDLRQQLYEYPDVVGAWLLQKQLTYFPEKPLFVLLIELTPDARKSFDKGTNKSNIVDLLSRRLDLPGEAFVVPATNDNAWLTTIARKYPAARCYEAVTAGQ